MPEPKSVEEYQVLKRRRFKYDFRLRIFTIAGALLVVIVDSFAPGTPTEVVSAIFLVGILCGLVLFIRAFVEYAVEKSRRGFRWMAWGDRPKSR